MLELSILCKIKLVKCFFIGCHLATIFAPKLRYVISVECMEFLGFSRECHWEIKAYNGRSLFPTL